MPIYLLSGECHKNWDTTQPVTFFCGLPVVASNARLARTRAEIVLAPAKIDTVRTTDCLPNLELVESDWMRQNIAQLVTA